DLAPGERSLSEALDLAHGAGAVLAASRALTDADLALPEERPAPTADAAELRTRADRAEARLREVVATLDQALGSGDPEAQIADALADLALFGVPEALSDAGTDPDALLARAGAVQRALARRLAEL